MPNHVTNTIRIHANPERIQEILKDIQNDEAGIGSLDFNKLIFKPKSLNIEAGSRTQKGSELYRAFLKESMELMAYNLINNVPKETVNETVEKLIGKYTQLAESDPGLFTLGQQAYNNIVQYGYPTWYEWSNANWGTKWNAYEFRPYGGGDSISFLTAWDSVPNILAALSMKYPDVSFDYSWADENIGYNVGKSTYLDGSVIDSYIPMEGSKEAYELFAEIMGVDLAIDYELYLSEDGTTYTFRECYEEDDSLEV